MGIDFGGFGEALGEEGEYAVEEREDFFSEGTKVGVGGGFLDLLVTAEKGWR